MALTITMTMIVAMMTMMVVSVSVSLSEALIVSVRLSLTIFAIPLTLTVAIWIPLILAIPPLFLHDFIVTGAPTEPPGPVAAKISEPTAIGAARSHCHQGSEEDKS